MLGLVGAALALAADVATLHVGVHRAAGTVLDVAADGAIGQCTVGPARVSCPADGPVRFRWGGDPDFAFSGDTEAGPGEVAAAWVLATEESVAPWRARLAVPTEAVVRQVFVGAGGAEPPAASAGLVDDLVALTRHADPLVRRAAVEGLVPWWRCTASDPLDVDAPEILPPGLIVTLASDPDMRVRRMLARNLRDVRSPRLQAEAWNAMMRFEADRPPVERAALASMNSMVRAGRAPAEEAWVRAMEAALDPGPPGRAAANTLAWLARSLDPSADVDPAAAVDRVLSRHPERAWKVWYAWRDAVPFHGDRAALLLRTSVGLHAGLLRFWADTDPSGLAAVVRAWEPAAPHTERFAEAATALSQVAEPDLRSALALPSRDR
jgi:hypothetical protein